MGKITVFALLGLIAIGGFGWALGEPPPRPEPGHQDNRFASANSPQGKSRIDTKMLEGWMLRRETPYLLIDTRSAASFSAHHLHRAINREFDALLSLQSLRRLPRHKAIVVYGLNDRQNAKAVDILRLAGLTAFYLPGDNASWASLPSSDASNATPQIAKAETAAPQANNKPPAPQQTERGLNTPQQGNMAKSNNPTLQLGMLND
jgi:rhodanese-related sulfurtransferase